MSIEEEEEGKASSFVEDMTVPVENPEESTTKSY